VCSSDLDRAVTAPRVKLCGFTRDDDVAHAAHAGADFLGLNLWPRSKRHVSVARAAELAAVARAARAGVQVVGLFVDAPAAEILATPPDFIEAIGLGKHLSMTRSNGLASLIARIKQVAQDA